ncbi:RWD domain-containing protein 2B [Aplochiton taeniatus]
MSHLEWAESQLAEIELLSSMFLNQEEFEITDQMALAELRENVEGSTDTPNSSRPQFIIKQRLDTGQTACVNEGNITVECTYPSEYPSVLPEVAVRSPELSRAQQTQLHVDLNRYLLENCQGDICVLSAVEWVRDNGHLYIIKSRSFTVMESASQATPQVFTRLWIYSHHIYNKIKRKSILEWSKELGLSGFSMPGKPGIVCVEGLQGPCEEFWSRVKVLTWKKIMIRHREDVTLDSQGMVVETGESMDSLCRFTGFEEAMFDPHGNRGNHMDLGQLYQFLNDKGCSNVFQLYFGVEGR